MGTIKDRNGMDLGGAKDIKILGRGGKNTQKNYKINLNNPNNHDDVILT